MIGTIAQRSKQRKRCPFFDPRVSVKEGGAFVLVGLHSDDPSFIGCSGPTCERGAQGGLRGTQDGTNVRSGSASLGDELKGQSLLAFLIDTHARVKGGVGGTNVATKLRSQLDYSTGPVSRGGVPNRKSSIVGRWRMKLFEVSEETCDER